MECIEKKKCIYKQTNDNMGEDKEIEAEMRNEQIKKTTTHIWKDLDFFSNRESIHNELT